jgi:hypothetical protein
MYTIHSLIIKGIDPQKAQLYVNKNDKFTCFDGKKTIKYTQLNGNLNSMNSFLTCCCFNINIISFKTTIATVRMLAMSQEHRHALVEISIV